MISYSDKMKLSNHKIFKDLSESLKENPSGKLRNLLELRDDVLYVWNSIENCLSSLNLKHLEEHDEETPYQKLCPLSPPQYTVERITTSSCGGRVCVWGSRGVNVVELPSRWGRGGLFGDGSSTVPCKSVSLDERFLYSQVEVRRVQWHSSSLSHLWVLVSDNTIRLYNIALKSGPKLLKIFTIGPKPAGLLASRPLLDSLGDTAVDFTTTPGADSLLILRGNGDVYMMECDLEAKTLHHKLTGPLAMYPPADDNYGSESCSIIALSNSSDMPPLVVVATCTAQLYHCLLLPNASEGEDSHALYVVEAVELSIVLNPDDNVEMQYSYPVHLYPCSNNTYACMHAGGVHTVTLPVLNQLNDYALANESESETQLSAILSRASVARHLVCTAGPRATLSPPVGLALTQPPLPALLVLCTDATVLSRTLEPYDLEDQLYKEFQLRNPALDQDEINNILKERQKLSFTAIVQEILARDVSQPILNINSKEEPSPKESLEFLSGATLKLRAQYVARQRRVAGAARAKLAALRALAAQHHVWHQDLQKDIEEVTLKSAVLKEKALLAEKHQDDIKYRCSAVIRKLRASAPATAAERELLAELQQYRLCGERAADQLRRLKEHARHKHDQLNIWQEEYKRKEISLGKSHKDIIFSTLRQQYAQLSTLVEETKLLKDQLSIV